MGKTTAKAQLIFKQVVGKLTGDDNEVKAAKIARKAISSVESEIASLDYKKLEAEEELEYAQERLEDAKFPTFLIDDRKAYLTSIQGAYERVQKAQEKLDNIVESKKFFENLLDEFIKEV